MVSPYRPKERTSDAIRAGFDADPEEREVAEGEVLYVYRAHGETSKMIGRFFFTPRVGDQPRTNWTADLLERELNAALWGNDFRYLAKFRVRSGVRYRIGPIAHDRYQGVEYHQEGQTVKEVPFDQYSYFRNSSLFYQVQIEMEADWRTYVELIENTPIKQGRHVVVGRWGNA
jgi:hypothetical protein